MAVQTLFLESTASAVVTGSAATHKMTTVGTGTATTTVTGVQHGTNTGEWQLVPSVAANTAAYTPSTTPNTKGWFFDGQTPGIYAAGNWTFTLHVLDNPFSGTGKIIFSLWLVTTNGTNVTSVQQLANAVASGATAFTGANQSFNLSATLPQVTVAANQYLYCEVYLQVTIAGTNAASILGISENGSASVTRIGTTDFFTGAETAVRTTTGVLKWMAKTPIAGAVRAAVGALKAVGVGYAPFVALRSVIGSLCTAIGYPLGGQRTATGWLEVDATVNRSFDYTFRLIQLAPQSWFSNAALTIGGNFYALMSALATAPTTIRAIFDYIRLQTRIASATEQNLEAIANDYFGPGAFPRYTLLGGNNLIPESDAQYSARIRAQIVAPQDTLAAIQAAVIQYLTTLYIEESVNNVMLLGLDSVGSLDGWGGLDGRPNSLPALPTVRCFDRQSDPVNSAKISLQPGDFCVLFSYGGLAQEGFFVGRSYLGRDTFLIDPGIQVVDALTPALDAIVRSTKAVGTTPVYADNRVN